MSAYSRIYQGLVAGGMRPDAVAALLAELRRETGAELSAGLRAHAKEIHQEQPNDSRALARKRKAKFGAMQRAADWLTAATSNGRLTTTPHQRNNRSTP
ncbi:hypothetical protein [Streptomyces sp. PR69]|uniref:hypothetical protein n=1 Tax=Streptomyces sp. PR69 TaxID=2984950 RepID=UPI0022647D6E|nr:hypothetical protein [Streptomyces sp. PR69]